jgi:predicted N-acetyltransferase YhbS
VETDSSPWAIRLATPDDAAAILRLTQAAFAAHGDVLDPPSGVFHETEDDVRQAMQDGAVIVATRDAVLLGAARMRPLPEQQALYCGRLAVDPHAQGSGVGSSLMTAVERRAADEGYAAVVLGVRVQLEENLRFFAGRGYRQIGEHSHPGYTYTTYVRLRKDLHP